MSQHYTKNTVSVSKWCNDCNAFTDHRVNGGRITNVCIPCQAKAEAAHQARIAADRKNPLALAVQEGLFS